MVGRRHFGVFGVLLFAGCGFQPQAASDAKIVIIDTPVDEPTSSLPRSCKDLLAAHPSTVDGTYMVDPDGDGGAPPVSVQCDMRTLGGGWTLVLLPAPNQTSAPNAYLAPLTLLADAGTVLVGYRDSSSLIAPNYAAFDLPTVWRTMVPFTIAESQFSAMVSVNGQVGATATVFAGYENFNGSTCGDPWTSATMFGRFCINGTNAPFYNGFSDVAPDNCSDSMASWNGTSCGPERRFSIAVR